MKLYGFFCYLTGNNWIVFEMIIKNKPTSFKNGAMRYFGHVVPYGGGARSARRRARNPVHVFET